MPSRRSNRAGSPASQRAEVAREYGPFPGVASVHGVTFDGSRVWFAAGEELVAFDPEDGSKQCGLRVEGNAGTAFDGKYLYQLAPGRIDTIDPHSGRIVRTVAFAGEGYSGLTWAEGLLWVGQYGDRKILQIDPATGRILRTLESDRYVTGVTWIEGNLWHATWEDDESELRQVDTTSGEVVARLELPRGTMVSGLEASGRDTFYCGGGSSGRVRAVRRSSK